MLFARLETARMGLHQCVSYPIQSSHVRELDLAAGSNPYQRGVVLGQLAIDVNNALCGVFGAGPPPSINDTIWRLQGGQTCCADPWARR